MQSRLCSNSLNLHGIRMLGGNRTRFRRLHRPETTELSKSGRFWRNESHQRRPGDRLQGYRCAWLHEAPTREASRWSTTGVVWSRHFGSMENSLFISSSTSLPAQSLKPTIASDPAFVNSTVPTKRTGIQLRHRFAVIPSNHGMRQAIRLPPILNTLLTRSIPLRG